jgi:hypothetical protein
MSGYKKRNEADLILGIEDTVFASAAQGLHLMHKLQEAGRQGQAREEAAGDASGTGDLLFDLLRLHVEMQQKRIELGFRFVDGIFDLLEQRSSRGPRGEAPRTKLCLSGTMDQPRLTGTFSLMNATAQPLAVTLAAHPFQQDDGTTLAGSAAWCTLTPASATIAPGDQLEVTVQVSPAAFPAASPATNPAVTAAVTPAVSVYRSVIDVQRASGSLHADLLLEVRLSPLSSVSPSGGSSTNLATQSAAHVSSPVTPPATSVAGAVTPPASPATNPVTPTPAPSGGGGAQGGGT